MKRLEPRIRITDEAFRYTPAAATDVAATFKRARKRMAEEAAARQAADDAEREAKVRAIRKAAP